MSKDANEGELGNVLLIVDGVEGEALGWCSGFLGILDFDNTPRRVHRNDAANSESSLRHPNGTNLS